MCRCGRPAIRFEHQAGCRQMVVNIEGMQITYLSLVLSCVCMCNEPPATYAQGFCACKGEQLLTGSVRTPPVPCWCVHLRLRLCVQQPRLRSLIMLYTIQLKVRVPTLTLFGVLSQLRDCFVHAYHCFPTRLATITSRQGGLHCSDGADGGDTTVPRRYTRSTNHTTAVVIVNSVGKLNKNHRIRVC